MANDIFHELEAIPGRVSYGIHAITKNYSGEWKELVEVAALGYDEAGRLNLLEQIYDEGSIPEVLISESRRVRYGLETPAFKLADERRKYREMLLAEWEKQLDPGYEALQRKLDQIQKKAANRIRLTPVQEKLRATQKKMRAGKARSK